MEGKADFADGDAEGVGFGGGWLNRRCLCERCREKAYAESIAVK
jgi:hypothetical protein